MLLLVVLREVLMPDVEASGSQSGFFADFYF